MLTVLTACVSRNPNSKKLLQGTSNLPHIIFTWKALSCTDEWVAGCLFSLRNIELILMWMFCSMYEQALSTPLNALWFESSDAPYKHSRANGHLTLDSCYHAQLYSRYPSCFRVTYNIHHKSFGGLCCLLSHWKEKFNQMVRSCL